MNDDDRRYLEHKRQQELLAEAVRNTPRLHDYGRGFKRMTCATCRNSFCAVREHQFRCAPCYERAMGGQPPRGLEGSLR